MKNINRLVVLTITIAMAVGCGNKNNIPKTPFDYTVLPSWWTALSDTDGKYVVCDEADRLVIEENRLTRLFIAAGEKWELEILKSYRIGDTIIMNVKQTDQEWDYDFKFIWLDKDKGIARWIFQDNGLDDGIFVTKEKISGFPEVRCEDDPETGSVHAITKSDRPDDLVRSDEDIQEKISGDLNKDGEDDCVIITRQTKKSAFVTDEHRGELDRNRRGILIAVKEGGYYRTIMAAPDCFSSENEDGGVYFPPELSVQIKKGNLVIHYGHGRYGWWQYIFRYRDNNFELIGYDESNNRGPVMESSVSINFLTKKKQTRRNTNTNDDEEEVIEETWQRIDITDLIKLTDITDFDGFSVSSCYSQEH